MFIVCTFLPKQIPWLCKLSWPINPFLILILILRGEEDGGILCEYIYLFLLQGVGGGTDLLPLLKINPKANTDAFHVKSLASKIQNVLANSDSRLIVSVEDCISSAANS